jgi:hypothetical protein
MTEIISIVGEPKQSAAAYRAAGITFIVAYGTFFFIALWRLLRYIRSTRLAAASQQPGPASNNVDSNSRSDYNRDKKLVVHVLLVLFSISEVLYGGFYVYFKA